jgi:tRNA A37 threonylcarbamoyladenosine biosynthesis protein TsaE
MIVRDLKDNLQRKFNMGKAIVLIGQVGKTTLVHALLKDIPFCFGW